MASRKNNTNTSSVFRMVNAVSAIKTLARSKSGLQSITIIPRERSEGFYVPTVIIGYSDGTETQISLEGWRPISMQELRDGLSLPNPKEKGSVRLD